MPEERRLIVRTPAEWNEEWSRLVGATSEPPFVDFHREMVLLAAMGQQPTGGYSVVIDRVMISDGWLDINVHHSRPGPTCGVTAALSEPVDIAIVPKTNFAPRWRVFQTVRYC